MTFSVRDGGVWKEAEPWVLDGDIWKPVQKGFVRDGGVWKEFYSAGPEPFLLSGSWEDGLEGWATTGGAGRTSGSSNARTGSYYVRSATLSAGTLTYTIPAEETAGLLINASVWVRRAGSGIQSASSRITVAEVGGGSETTNQSLGSQTYREISTSLLATGVGDIEVTIALGSTSQVAFADDWKIEGVAP